MSLRGNVKTGLTQQGQLRNPRQQQHRILDEELEYWRKRAGWFDDDVSMNNYNSGVSATYYTIDDDGTPRGNTSDGNPVGRHGKLLMNLSAVFISIAVAVLLYRFMTTRRSSSKVAVDNSTPEKKRSSSTGKDDRTRRSRSKSVSGRSRSSRSKSRSRSDKDYALMEDDAASDGRKSRSGRSRSVRRSRSRGDSSRKSSRSKSRSKKTEVKQPREIQEVLV